MNRESLFSAIGNISDSYIESAAPKNRHKRNNVRRRFATLAATAAIITFAVFGNLFVNPMTDNMFSLRAYSMELQYDGSVSLYEIDIDLINQMDDWGGHFDGEHLFLNIALQPVGENIKNIEFNVDKGFLAIQHITRENGVIVRDDRTPMIVTGAGSIALFGSEFEIMGSRFLLEADGINDDLLLFWGQEWDQTTRPGSISINAVATFNDGVTQEESVTVVFQGRPGAIIGPVSDRVPNMPSYTEIIEAIEERIRFFEERGLEMPNGIWNIVSIEEEIRLLIERGVEVPQDLMDRLSRLFDGNDIRAIEAIKEQIRLFEERGMEVPQALLDRISRLSGDSDVLLESDESLEYELTVPPTERIGSAGIISEPPYERARDAWITSELSAEASERVQLERIESPRERRPIEADERPISSADEVSREIIEERIRMLEELGLEVPQELLDMLNNFN